MALKLNSRIPYGNARDVSIDTEGDVPQVSFAADPHGGPESLWFCFSLSDTESESPHPAKVRLVLKYFHTMLGANRPVAFRPVFKAAGQGWMRLQGGHTETRPDGHIEVMWDLPYPDPEVQVAFCYPYGSPEVRNMIDRARGYWKSESIGLSQGGRRLMRLRNDEGVGGPRHSGVYLMARQHAGETPGSWVLDGLLQHMAAVKKNPLMVWAVPLADIDGVYHGDYGKDGFPYDLNRAWGALPMRHEVIAYQNDMRVWQERCRPMLAIDFHAPGACDTSGCYTFLPDPERHPEMHKAASKWANVLRDAVSGDYTAEEFARVASYPSRWNTPDFIDYCCGELKIPALTIETPYASAGKHLLSPKRYREIGRRIGDALIRRAK